MVNNKREERKKLIHHQKEKPAETKQMLQLKGKAIGNKPL